MGPAPARSRHAGAGGRWRPLWTSSSSERFRNLLRVPTLCLLVAAPLALGAVHEPAFVPLLVVGSAVGILSWARGHWVRAPFLVILGRHECSPS